MLAAGLAMVALTLFITLVRWWYLLWSIGVPISLWNGLRLGGLGLMLTFVSLGGVGGDAFKAVFLMKDYPKHRAESVASVLVDRLMALAGLFILVSIVALVWGNGLLVDWRVRMLVYFSYASTIGLCLGIAGIWLWERVRTGPHRVIPLEDKGFVVRGIVHLWRALRLYRSAPLAMGFALATTVVTHAMFALAVWFLAMGLPVPTPSLASCLIVAPMANLAGCAPLPLGGLGAMEGAMAILFTAIPGNETMTTGQGFLIAFAFRLAMILCATSGFGFYLGSRREIEAAYQETADEIDSGLLDEETDQALSDAASSSDTT